MQGIKISVGRTGIKYQDRDDLALIEIDEGSSSAIMMTKNSLCGEPIKWNKAHHSGTARAILINAGNANVLTGEKGAKLVEESANEVANKIVCNAKDILIASTGVIGEIIDKDKFLPEIAKLKSSDLNAAASAIMTTDTFPKILSKNIEIAGKSITINGIIKGSGMIEPNMATMLGFVFTDATIESSILQDMLEKHADKSYHCITVDSDSSTSDMVAVIATNKVDIEWNDENLKIFDSALLEIHQDLAKLVIKDGEGISKFITINVTGAISDNSAKTIGKSIANSPLVKTAIAGEDANWGRIAMAIGKTDEPIDIENCNIAIGNVQMLQDGKPNPNYNEADATTLIKQPEVTLNIKVGTGKGSSTIWTCDLTHEYISINADYRS